MFFISRSRKRFNCRNKDRSEKINILSDCVSFVISICCVFPRICFISDCWIGIRTVGTKSNRDGIGARVEVQAGQLKQMDEVRSGGSYLSQSDLRLHFGLGFNRKIDRLTVRWPSGVVDRLQNIPADQQIIIEEGSPAWKTATYPRY